MRRLYRAKYEKMLGGVCSGVADYFQLDPTLVRLGWILMSVFFFAGVIAYIICWIIMPEED